MDTQPVTPWMYIKKPMSLISLIIVLIVVGVLLWAVNTYLSKWMDPKIVKILNFVVVAAVVIYLLFAFGVLGRGNDIKIPKLG